MRAQMHANIKANVEAEPLTLNVGLVTVPSFGTSTNALQVTRCLYFSTVSVVLVRTTCCIFQYIVCFMQALVPIGTPWYPLLPSIHDVDARSDACEYRSKR